jgi:hypothetical protein
MSLTHWSREICSKFQIHLAPSVSLSPRAHLPAISSHVAPTFLPAAPGLGRFRSDTAATCSLPTEPTTPLSLVLHHHLALLEPSLSAVRHPRALPFPVFPTVGFSSLSFAASGPTLLILQLSLAGRCRTAAAPELLHHHPSELPP